MSHDALMLLGPTASGKSAFSLKLAQKFPIEIISIDSALVYRGMDIGSAKPSKEEMRVCPHHLIDIRDIDEPYSAADFVKDCTELVAQIRSRGNIPLIVGGTMLYAKALRDGMNDMPPTDEAIRAQVLEEGTIKGWPAMHAELLAIDPKTAKRLAPNDKQRIGRAIEVYRISGKPLSAFHGEKEIKPSIDVDTIGLMPSDRKRLHKAIEERFLTMISSGFIDEMRVLMEKPNFVEDSPAMRSVGYRQAIMYLKGEVSLERFIELGVIATRQLAKRQITWLRGMENITLLDPYDSDTLLALEEWCSNNR